MSLPALAPIRLVLGMPDLVAAHREVQHLFHDPHFVREGLVEAVTQGQLRRELELEEQRARVLEQLGIGRPKRERRGVPALPRGGGSPPSTIFVLTASGVTSCAVPTGCTYVRITTVGGGGGGGGGQTADNSVNRVGGGGGGASGMGQGVWSRRRLPSTLIGYVATGGTAGTPGGASGAGLISLVESQDTTYNGTSTPQTTTTICYSGGRASGGAQGSLGGAAGAGGTIPASTVAFWAHVADAWSPFVGQIGSAGAGGATPTALTPFNTTGAPFSGGCAGGGKSTVPTAFAGGGYAAVGHLGAIAGGAAPGGAGGSTAAFPGTTPDAIAFAYGGTGGGAHTAGTGGAGGAAGYGCGGGGGGAGTVSGGNGAAGGAGFVVIECF